MSTGSDDDGYYIESGIERYDLTVDEMLSVHEHGWPILVTILTETFGLRASLGVGWQASADRYLATHDPWVTPADSFAGGNCWEVTEHVRTALCRWAGGEIGAIRASVLLTHRLDVNCLDWRTTTQTQ
jgi:hypothetical protein